MAPRPGASPHGSTQPSPGQPGGLPSGVVPTGGPLGQLPGVVNPSSGPQDSAPDGQDQKDGGGLLGGVGKILGGIFG